MSIWWLGLMSRSRSDSATTGLGNRAYQSFGALLEVRISDRDAMARSDTSSYRSSANIGGLEFFFGIPGTIGGALRMNAGANGAETRDILIDATGVSRDGKKHTFGNADMKFIYRSSGVDPTMVFTSARFRGLIAAPEAIRARMNEVQNHRETAQPIREKTGGSTFQNPPHHSAWKLIDAAGCRGLRVGGAQVSEMHCNFLINTGAATGHDIEILGETVRARVKENSGIELHWEIKRIGIEH